MGTARDYAAQAGPNASTLCYGKWRLSREATLQTASRGAQAAPTPKVGRADARDACYQATKLMDQSRKFECSA